MFFFFSTLYGALFQNCEIDEVVNVLKIVGGLIEVDQMKITNNIITIFSHSLQSVFYIKHKI